MLNSNAELVDELRRNGYVADEEIATALFLAEELEKPILIEGEAGVGKTEIANVLAKLKNTEIIRLQCYEGLDFNSALYEWNYQKQILSLRLEEVRGRTDVAITDFYSDEATAHFDAVQAGLRALDIPFTLEPKLVRGLDYYRRTIFEFQGGTLDSAQNALGGGGRYDGLVEALGGPATSGIGFALGVDRTLLACDDEGVFAAEPRDLDAFVVDVVGGIEAAKLTAELRQAGFAADRGYDNRSMKAQMKLANRSNAAVAVIVGEEEVDANTVVVKPMRSGDQQTIPRSELIAYLSGNRNL